MGLIQPGHQKVWHQRRRLLQLAGRGRVRGQVVLVALHVRVDRLQQPPPAAQVGAFLLPSLSDLFFLGGGFGWPPDKPGFGRTRQTRGIILNDGNQVVNYRYGDRYIHRYINLLCMCIYIYICTCI